MGEESSRRIHAGKGSLWEASLSLHATGRSSMIAADWLCIFISDRRIRIPFHRLLKAIKLMLSLYIACMANCVGQSIVCCAQSSSP